MSINRELLMQEAESGFVCVCVCVCVHMCGRDILGAPVSTSSEK